MNYRTATRQQLLAERARLSVAMHKAEQRLGTARQVSSIGGGASKRSRGSTRTPQREVEQLAAQLATVDAELARRDQETTSTTSTVVEEAAGAGDS
jgi:hypothetical protein